MTRVYVPKHKSVKECMDHIYDNAPKKGEICTENPFSGTRFQYAVVEDAIARIHERGDFLTLDIYDIQGTFNLWVRPNGMKNHPLACRATARMVDNKQALLKLDACKTLPLIHATDFDQPFNEFATRLTNMFATVYKSHRYAALMDMINNTDRYAECRDFQPHHMQHAPPHTFTLPDGTKNYRLSADLVYDLVHKMAQDLNITAREACGLLNGDDLARYPIDKFGLTLEHMLHEVHRGSVTEALDNLLNFYPSCDSKAADESDRDRAA